MYIIKMDENTLLNILYLCLISCPCQEDVVLVCIVSVSHTYNITDTTNLPTEFLIQFIYSYRANLHIFEFLEENIKL